MPPDLEDRLILPMLNEAVACLREGCVADADLLDAGAIFATGFAPFRGGPLHYAKSGDKQRDDAFERTRRDAMANASNRTRAGGCLLRKTYCDPLRARACRGVW